MSDELRVNTNDLLATPDGFTVSIDARGLRADIILERPPLNIIAIDQREQLRATFEALDQHATVRIIVIRALGQNFSSGGDIATFLTKTPEHLSRLASNIAAPERCRKPVIAAVRGFAMGVGFELCLACDFLIVSETTQFALPEQRIGIIPGSGGTARLVKMVGVRRAKDIVMRARRVTGMEAAALGIATQCVADAELESSTDGLVDELLGFAPLAQRALKRLINATQDASLTGGIDLEGEAFGRLASTRDFREGVDAFREKRKPIFDGS